MSYIADIGHTVRTEAALATRAYFAPFLAIWSVLKSAPPRSDSRESSLQPSKAAATNEFSGVTIDASARFRRADERRRIQILNAFIDKGCEFDGTLRFHDALRIDGNFAGQVDAPDGELIIGETGQISGVINVGIAVVSGVIQGDIVANRLELHRNARVSGRVLCSFLIVEEGAFLKAPVRMVAPQQLSLSSLPSPMPQVSSVQNSGADLA